MKRLSLFLTLIITLVSLTGCENANITKLKKDVHSADAVYPISYGLGGDLISIKYHEKDNMVLMYYSLNEDLSSHVFLKQNKDNMMKLFRLSLSHEGSRQMLKDMNSEDEAKARRALLKYYCLDTLAMVKVLEKLYEVARI